MNILRSDQNMKIIKSEKGVDSKIAKIFQKQLKKKYNVINLPLTHPSLVFRVKILLQNVKNPIHFLIFSNGTLYFQGSPKIPKEVFNEASNDIVKIANSILKS